MVLIHSRSAWMRGTIMKPFPGAHSALLRAGSLMRIEASAGSRVICVRGMVWLTQEQDARDHILSAGETFVCDRAGTVLVNALAHDAVLDLPDPSRFAIVRPYSGRSALSLAADIGRIKARIEPQALRALPAGVRREVVEREARRMRRQVDWLVLQHARLGMTRLVRRLVACARGALLHVRRSMLSRARHSDAN